MKGLIWQAMLAIAQAIGAVIRKGKPVPTVFCGLLGAGIGATIGLAMIELITFGVVLGAVVGATAGAGLFPRPELPLGARAPGDEAEPMGTVLQHWTYELLENKSLTVLMERAVYVAPGDTMPWANVLEKLRQGTDPDVASGALIRLDEIEKLELRKPNATDPQIAYRAVSRTKRITVKFQSNADRDEFLVSLERQLGGEFVTTEEPMETRRAIFTPLVVLLVLILLTGATAWLSAYWIENPPPPLKKTGKQDEVVALLTRAGPLGVIYTGGVPIVIAGFWLALRAAWPPRLQILRLNSSGT
jgi:hypothetical protein